MTIDFNDTVSLLLLIDLQQLLLYSVLSSSHANLTSGLLLSHVPAANVFTPSPGPNKVIFHDCGPPRHPPSSPLE